MSEATRSAKRARLASSTPAEQQPGELGLMRRESRHREASFIGSASGIHFVKSVYNSLGAKTTGARSSTESNNHDLVPGEEDSLPTLANQRDTDSIWNAWEISSSTTYTGGADANVAFQDLIIWSQSFFDYWHPALPFLHAPTFLEWCERISQYPLAGVESVLNADQMTTLRSIMSISLADRRQATETTAAGLVPSALVFNSFREALVGVQSLLTAIPSIESLQSALSVQLFLVSMLRHNTASRLGGLIIRAVFQMGLHRCPVRFATFSKSECEMRQRLFWSVYCLDRYICQSLGTPITLRDDDIDVCYPNDERHSAEMAAPRTTDNRLVLLSLLSRHAGIKGLILELCNKSISHRHADTDEVATASLKVAKWANEVDHALELDSNETVTLNQFHQATLSVLHQESIIVLNRPLLTVSKYGSDFSAALQACISASRSIIRTLAAQIQLYESTAENKTPLLWPSFTWATWMSAFIIVYAANEKEIPLAVAISLATKGFEILQHLGTRGSIWPGQCATVIKDLIERLRGGTSASGADPSHTRDMSESGSRGTAPHRPVSQAQTNAPADWANERQDSQMSDRWAVRDQDVFYNSASSLYDSGATDNLANILQANGLEPSNMFNVGNVDFFQGFEIPFWMEDDQYLSINSGPST